VVLSLQLGFAVIPLIHFTSDKKKMGEFAIKPWVKLLAWLSAIIIVSLNIKLVYEEISSWMNTTNNWWLYIIIVPIVLAVVALLFYVSFHPLLKTQTTNPSNVPHGDALEIPSVENVSYSAIGIPVDFSKNDKATIEHALMQGGKDARYFLIHIVETAGARYHGDRVMDFETKSDTDNLDVYRLNLEKLGYNAQTRIGYGNVARAISRLATDNQLDLLVMGAHGHQTMKDMIFGTTVNAVRHRLKIPILIVRK
jgi:manganese transport protein